MHAMPIDNARQVYLQLWAIAVQLMTQEEIDQHIRDTTNMLEQIAAVMRSRRYGR